MDSTGSALPSRRAVLKAGGAGAVGAAGIPLLAATGSGAAPPTTTPSSLLPAPPSQVEPLLTRQDVNRALRQLDGMIQDALEHTGVPGIAASVVYRDEVVYLKGFGIKEVGKPGRIGPDTVFQLASVSKPLASTAVAGVVGRNVITWDGKIVEHNPDFSLNDPYVTQNATFADLLSHRSGLRTAAGDLLEDLGFDRDYILAHLHQQPLDTFRSSYNYSNFGYTAGGHAAALAMGMSWEDLADQILFRPLGMTSTSYRYSDYEKAADRAIIHVPVGNKEWAPRYRRDADSEAPAGGASSSVRDLAQWLRLQLGQGTYDGQPVIDPDALQTTYVPHAVSGPARAPAVRSRFYGLGWNVSTDDQGRVQLGHSGAFNLGTATAVSMLPGEQLAIVVLTNGRPQGIPEAITAGFLDTAQHGKPTVDWLTFTAAAFHQLDESEKPEKDYTQVPPNPAPSGPNSTYTGTYNNSYYGPLVVFDENGTLAMRMGPADSPTTFPLTHYDGGTFSFESIGENGNGLAGALFAAPQDGRSPAVTLDFYDRTGLGTFTRA